MSVPGNLVSTITAPLRWGDMDAYGHANNTVYVRILEEARIVRLADSKIGMNGPTAPISIKARATFLMELKQHAR